MKFDGRLVKYFNPLGGTWTVEEKRVPALNRATEVFGKDADPKSAAGAAFNSHTLRMSSIPSNASVIPSSTRYGQRTTLEQFGVAHHGIKQVRTNLPSN